MTSLGLLHVLKDVISPIRTLHDLTPAAPANAIALTIDDGPHPYWTPKILDVLAEFDVPATFNMIGIQVPDNTRLVQRIVAAGHQMICLGWQIDPRDWSRPGIPHITTTLQQAQPGDTAAAAGVSR
jgi:peptidoglycan/xylan/chitin deacetylase (PgdA/CDA1 family)